MDTPVSVIDAPRNLIGRTLYYSPIIDPILKEMWNDINKETGMNLPIPKFLAFAALNNNGNIKRSVGGYFHPFNNGNFGISISIEYYENNGAEEVKMILRHEMVHAYCFINHLGYKDNDLDFCFFLGKFGGLRHCDFAAFKPQKKVYAVSCELDEL